MGIEVKRIQQENFNELFNLFGKRKNPELINWVYSHPRGDGKSAYVAFEEGKLAGAIGYVCSDYNINGEIKKGIIPLSWEVEKEKRGFVGTKLLFSALKGADFYLGMDGSEDMKMIFGKLNFKKIGEGISARKILSPFGYLKTLQRIGPRDLLRTVRYILNNLSYKAKPKQRLLYEISDYDPNTVSNNKQVFHNVISNEHIQWLKKNPGMKLYVFEAKIGDKKYAPILINIKEIKNGYKRGQIVHLPPVEKSDENYLPDILLEIEGFFRTNKVSAITTLVTNTVLQKALSKRGYRFDKKIRPIIFKGPREIFEILNKTELHLSFAETDKSVRNI